MRVVSKRSNLSVCLSSGGMAGRRFFSAQMEPEDHATPEQPYHVIFHAFCKWKLLGDKLGYGWQVDTQALKDTPLQRHYDCEEGKVELPMLSPVLADRWAVLDFPGHTVTFKQWKEPVTTATYRGRWVRKLMNEFQYSEEEAKALVHHMEEVTKNKAPGYLAPELNKLVMAGASPYLYLREKEVSERTLFLPGNWLTHFKRFEWPSLSCPF